MAPHISFSFQLQAEKSIALWGTSQNAHFSCLWRFRLPLLLGLGSPTETLPVLTHGVTLLGGPNGAPSLHTATQGPALFQILKGQIFRVRARAREKQKGWPRPSTKAKDLEGSLLTLTPPERTGSKMWSRKPSRLPGFLASPVEQGYIAASTSGPLPSTLPISVCLTWGAAAGQCWGWAWRESWGQGGSLNTRGWRDVLSSAENSGTS